MAVVKARLAGESMEDLSIQKRELFSAILRNDVLQVKRLSATNVSPYHRNSQGQTAMAIALQLGNKAIIRLLKTAAAYNPLSKPLFLSSDVVSAPLPTQPLVGLATDQLSNLLSGLATVSTASYSTLVNHSELRISSFDYSTVINGIANSKHPIHSVKSQSGPTIELVFSPQHKPLPKHSPRHLPKHLRVLPSIAVPTPVSSAAPALTSSASKSSNSSLSNSSLSKPKLVTLKSVTSKSSGSRSSTSRPSALRPMTSTPTTPNADNLPKLPEGDLAVAVVQNDLETVRALIKKPVDLRPVHWYDTPVLVTAAQQGLLEMVQLLVSAGANVNSGYEQLPLHCAAENGDLNIVQFLLGAGAYLEAKEIGDRTALMAAAGAGRLSVVEYLVSRGANLKAVNAQKENALMIAAKRTHQQVYDYLCQLLPQPNTEAQTLAASDAQNRTVSSANAISRFNSQSTAEDSIMQSQQLLLEDLQDYVETSIASPAPPQAKSADELRRGYQEIVQAMDRPIDEPVPNAFALRKNCDRKWLAS